LKIANDFVEHSTTRWEAGKAMLVCIDKITCARMLQLIEPLWQAKAVAVRAEAEAKLAEIKAASDEVTRQQLHAQRDRLLTKAKWIEQTLIEIIISEAQNEVADFKKWDFDIIPHRKCMKLGFETPDGKRVDVESAFKDPGHPFRVAIVCAMWLTGFDVESLSTLYIDKPMKAHTLMQAIARANRRYPGKDFGLIVDYNGMLKALREALAQYALGDEGNSEQDIIAPIEERLAALQEAIEVTEAHLLSLGFDPSHLLGSQGFARIALLKDAVESIYAGAHAEKSEIETGKNASTGGKESKRRFEILARVVFSRFKALLTEPSVVTYAERHDNIEAIYKKLLERRDTADVTSLLKELHRIVNEAIQAETAGEDHTESKQYDLSQIDLEKLRDEFTKKVKRKATALQDIFEILEQKLAQMLAKNPLRIDYYKKYQEIIADYNRDKDRITIEETFVQVMELIQNLDQEQQRTVEEGLSEEQLAIFDLIRRGDLSKTEREKVKEVSRELLADILHLLGPLDQWTEKEQTQAEVKTFILDHIYQTLPEPPYSSDDKDHIAELVFQHVWQQSVRGGFPNIQD